MAAPVRDVLAIATLALPFGAAAVLTAIGSARVGGWVSLGAAGLLFLLACVIRQEPAMLVAFVALTTGWFALRDVATPARFQHAAFQVLIGAILLAMWADRPIVSWLSLVIAVSAAAVLTGASAAASRLLRLCGIGLTAALLGIALLDQSPELAAALVLLGLGTLAGLAPLHAWLTGAAAAGTGSGATIVTVLLPTAPVLLFMRLPLLPGLLVAYGLVSLLLGAVALLVHEDVRRRTALAGMAQVGMMLVAIGIGATMVAWLHLVLLSVLRAAVLQSRGDDVAAWAAFALLPLYALYLLAAPAAAFAVWLLAVLAAVVALLVLSLLRHRPSGLRGRWIDAAPIWLQVAVVAILAVAVPAR